MELLLFPHFFEYNKTLFVTAIYRNAIDESVYLNFEWFRSYCCFYSCYPNLLLGIQQNIPYYCTFQELLLPHFITWNTTLFVTEFSRKIVDISILDFDGHGVASIPAISFNFLK